MTEAAKQAKARYAKEYREKNRERINARRREWSRENPDKVKQQQETFWRKKAEAEATAEGGTGQNGT